MSEKTNEFQWKTILGGIILVFISLVVVTVFEFIGGKYKASTTQTLDEPKLTMEGMKENKGKVDNRLSQTENLRIVKLYDQPLTTPSYVSNQQELTKYLERNTAEIIVVGELSEAYLYIKTGPIDINKESVYFWIVDGTSDGGHLLPTDNLGSQLGNEFLYDLEKLPIVQRPYSIHSKPKYINVVNKYLNTDINYKADRQYYVGAFVSTTLLPNQIDDLEIRYWCKQGSSCLIKRVI